MRQTLVHIIDLDLVQVTWKNLGKYRFGSKVYLAKIWWGYDLQDDAWRPSMSSNVWKTGAKYSTDLQVSMNHMDLQA